VTGSGAFNRDPSRAAEVFRMTYGDKYDIGFADGAWRAGRLDGTGDPLTGETPDELAAALRADWGARSARGQQ
jgi:hypothetical protein